MTTSDLEQMTIPRMVLRSAERYGDAVAVIDGHARLTFREVADGMIHVGANLATRGVEPGDRVGLWAPNSASWILMALGIHAAGAALVPLNTRYKPGEAATILLRADVRNVLVVEEFLETDYPAALRSADPASSLNILPIPGPGSYERFNWMDARHDTQVDVKEVRRRVSTQTADAVSDIIFTSGTTGVPKGVQLRHGTSLRCYDSYNSAYRLAQGDRHLVATPFFHCFGYKAGWMLSLLVGATTIPMATFDAARVLELVETHGVTHMPGAPTMFYGVLDHPSRDDHDLSSMRTAIIAAASIPQDLVRRMYAELSLDTVMTGYGLTENHALGTFTRPEDPPEVVSSTVGRPAPNIEVRIVDDSDRPLSLGEQGEVLLRGYAHMTGYLDDPDATRASFLGDWLRTGDVGYVDAEGNLHITDRKKDIYISGGFNVSPAEVENALIEHPAVSSVAVVGVPDDHLGEVGAAWVVAVPGSSLAADDVQAFARERLANFKVPRRVTLVDELPTNATGKILRYELRNEVVG